MPDTRVPRITPDFLLIGAMKAATSTLSAYFEDHPQTFMVPKAEPHYFSHDDKWEKGPDWYASFFDGVEPGQLIGEGSNSYTSVTRFPEAPGRIHSVAPEARLIYMVREPVGRIISHWIQARTDRARNVSASIDKAVLAERKRFVDPSRYWCQIERYLEFFPRERIFVGFLEDLQSDPQTFFASVCAFLEIDPVTRPERAKQNTSAGKQLPTQAFERVRGVPGLRQIARLVPRGARRSIQRRLFWRPMDDRPAFSPEVERQIRAELASDTARFLDFCSRPADFWDRKTP